MQVTVGWATEYARFKHSVTVDEGDLRRMLAEVGIPAELAAQCTASEAFKILDAAAQTYCVFSQLEAGEDTPENARKRIAEWQGVLRERLDAVRKRLGAGGE